MLLGAGGVETAGDWMDAVGSAIIEGAKIAWGGFSSLRTGCFGTSCWPPAGEGRAAGTTF